MLLECRTTEILRGAKWQDVIRSMPVAMRNEMTRLGCKERFMYIVSAMGGYVEEWDDIYHRILILIFVESMYIQAKTLSDTAD
jgi:hypothetical protein